MAGFPVTIGVISLATRSMPIAFWAVCWLHWTRLPVVIIRSTRLWHTRFPSLIPFFSVFFVRQCLNFPKPSVGWKIHEAIFWSGKSTSSPARNAKNARIPIRKLSGNWHLQYLINRLRVFTGSWKIYLSRSHSLAFGQGRYCQIYKSISSDSRFSINTHRNWIARDVDLIKEVNLWAEH